MVAFKSYEGDLFRYIDQKHNLKCFKKNCGCRTLTCPLSRDKNR